MRVWREAEVCGCIACFCTSAATSSGRVEFIWTFLARDTIPLLAILLLGDDDDDDDEEGGMQHKEEAAGKTRYV